MRTEVTDGPRAVWLETGADLPLAFLHLPQRERRSTAVLLCPPFGWDEMCSYRGRRIWAQMLSGAGYPTARIDLPSAGDSGGSPRDPHRLVVWRSAVAGAARWLRENTESRRLAAIGIGLGGMMAYCAAADGAPIDDLVLWAVPVRGRGLVRALTAQAHLLMDRYRDPPSPEAAGGLEVAGFLLSAETKSALEGLDLSEMPLPVTRRVLLLGRDDFPPDQRLEAHLENLGAEVTVAGAKDYGELMLPPQESKMPVKTIERTLSWLAEGSNQPGQPSDSGATLRRAAPVERESVELRHSDGAVHEEILTLPSAAGRLFAILSQPVGQPQASICGVLLNSGAFRHTGPSRIWVEVARRWATQGVPTVRLDLEGIGDSDGDERPLVHNAPLYSEVMVRQVLDVLGQLAQRGLPNRYVLAGVCSGAYWALHAALADPRVLGAFMINLYSFYWSPELVAERDRREALQALRDGTVVRLVRGKVSGARIRRALRSFRSGTVKAVGGHSVEAAQRADIEAALDRLRDQRTRSLFLFTEGEPLHDQLQREGWIERLDRWPNVVIERIPSRDHLFRSLQFQRDVHRALDAQLQHVLGMKSGLAISGR